MSPLAFLVAPSIKFHGLKMDHNFHDGLEQWFLTLSDSQTSKTAMDLPRINICLSHISGFK